MTNRLIQLMQCYKQKQGISQQEFGRRVEVDQSTISRILNEKQEPSIHLVDRLAQVMQRDLIELVFAYLNRPLPPNYVIAQRVESLSDSNRDLADRLLLALFEQEQKTEKDQ